MRHGICVTYIYLCQILISKNLHEHIIRLTDTYSAHQIGIIAIEPEAKWKTQACKKNATSSMLNNNNTTKNWTKSIIIIKMNVLHLSCWYKCFFFVALYVLFIHHTVRYSKFFRFSFVKLFRFCFNKVGIVVFAASDIFTFYRKSSAFFMC